MTILNIIVVIAILVIIGYYISQYCEHKGNKEDRQAMLHDYLDAKNSLTMMCNRMLRHGMPVNEIDELVQKAADAAILADALQLDAPEEKYIPLAAVFDGSDFYVLPEQEDLEGHA